MDLRADLFYSFTGCEVSSYFQSALARILVALRFASPNQLVGFLFSTPTL